MKQTAMQQAILGVKKIIDSQNDTLMGKHTAHHLQQVERKLYDLLEIEQEQIEEAYDTGLSHGYIVFVEYDANLTGKEYYKETYGEDENIQ